ncbi:hypothetical protein L1887_11055 [Cichorium endivia]|nr:hypothetical protein L1887_11055 [Cichorium endivia]
MFLCVKYIHDTRYESESAVSVSWSQYDKYEEIRIKHFKTDIKLLGLKKCGQISSSKDALTRPSHSEDMEMLFCMLLLWS